MDDKTWYTFDNIRREPYFLQEDEYVIVHCSCPPQTRTHLICGSNKFTDLERRIGMKRYASGFLDHYVKRDLDVVRAIGLYRLEKARSQIRNTNGTEGAGPCAFSSRVLRV